MGVVYVLLIELSHAQVFECWDRRSVSMVPLHIIAVIVATVFVLAVALHGRQVNLLHTPSLYINCVYIWSST